MKTLIWVKINVRDVNIEHGDDIDSKSCFRYRDNRPIHSMFIPFLYLIFKIAFHQVAGDLLFYNNIIIKNKSVNSYQCIKRSNVWVEPDVIL